MRVPFLDQVGAGEVITPQAFGENGFAGKRATFSPTNSTEIGPALDKRFDAARATKDFK
ncbi:MAG: hypothetical protein ABIR70_19840 [Bryobacteraceae bacterium]